MYHCQGLQPSGAFMTVDTEGLQQGATTAYT